jgi:steroid 5-alpha reductase family enzyme
MTSTAMITAAVTIGAFMLAMWLLSLALKNASIVDIGWGIGFVLVAWTEHVVVGGKSDRQQLLVMTTTIWGVRLAWHLFNRNNGQPEDYRYRAMRKRWGPRFPLVSLGTVFAVQGALMWIVSLPLQLGQVTTTPGLGALAWIGFSVCIVGLYFEAVGDAQLARFKKDPANAGKVMDQGLWRYTRHPNYFGDACVWWGIAIMASEVPVARWGLIGAVVMTVLLRRVSGVTLLEKSLVKRRAGYDQYVATTSPFIPRPPKRP